jgi:Zn-dependent oligopeptidase
MNAAEAQRHIEDIKNELGLLLFHEQTLLREIEMLKPKFESSIVRPKITNVRNMTKNDLDIDVIQLTNATKETIEARKAFYYASMELAQIYADIAAKKELINTYKAHIQQDLNKQSKPMTEEMIFEKLKKAQSLTNLSPEEKDSLKTITDDLPKRLNAGKDARIELYETLQNFILQHG